MLIEFLTLSLLPALVLAPPGLPAHGASGPFIHSLVVRTSDAEQELLPGTQVSLWLVGDGTPVEVEAKRSDGRGEAHFQAGAGTYEVRAGLEGFMDVTAGPLVLDDEHRIIDDLPIMLPTAAMSVSLINFSAAPPARHRHKLVARVVDFDFEKVGDAQVSLLRMSDGETSVVEEQTSNAEAEVHFEVGEGTYFVRAALDGFVDVTVGPLVLDDDRRVLGPVPILLWHRPLPLSLIRSF